MHPILTVLHLGADRPIGSYGLMVGLAILTVGAVAVRASMRARCDVGATFAVLACVVAGGFLSATITFSVVELVREGELHAGGLVAYGSLPGAILAAWGSGRWLRLPVWRLLDLSIPGVAAGHALGRIGCFLGGCCYGAQSNLPWAVVYRDPAAPAFDPSTARHPSPLYESLGLLLLALSFALIPAKEPGSTRRALVYLGAYATLRFLVESTRGDAVRGIAFGVLSTSQLVSMVMLVAVAIVLARYWPTKNRVS